MDWIRGCKLSSASELLRKHIENAGENYFVSVVQGAGIPVFIRPPGGTLLWLDLHLEITSMELLKFLTLSAGNTSGSHSSF